MKAISLISALLLVAASGAQAQGMSLPAPAKPANSEASAGGKSAVPLVDAEVRKVDVQKGVIVLKHGDITNLGMPAMTMGFDVANKTMLKGLKVGDKVKFQVEMVDNRPLVTELKPAR
jgi:Cu/Ag efflux protein CusF